MSAEDARRHRLSLLRNCWDLRKDLEDADYPMLEACMRRVDVEGGDRITHIERPSQGLYLVEWGLVAITHRPELRRAPISYALGPRSLFGEDCLTGNHTSGASAERDCRLHLLRLDHLRELAERRPSTIGRMLTRLAALHRLMPRLASAVRRNSCLRHVPTRLLWSMFEGAWFEPSKGDLEADLPAGRVIWARGEHPGRIAIVVRGRLQRRLPRGPSYQPVGTDAWDALDCPGPDQVVGDVEVITNERSPYDVVTLEPTRLLCLEPQRYQQLLEVSDSFRRAVIQARRDLLPPERAVPAILSDPAEVVLLTGGSDHPVHTLTCWLAQALRSDFDDGVTVVHEGEGTVMTGSWKTVSSDDAGQTLVDAGEQLHGADTDFVLVARPRRALTDALKGHVHKIALLLEPGDEVPDDISETSAPLLVIAVVPDPAQADQLLATRRVARGAVRLPRSVLEAARRGGPCPPEHRAHVQRLARAVSDRRVGLALGGGAALGFAHLALLEAIEARGVPIDMVSGASVGTTVGAFYCARGLDGLAQLLDHVRGLERAGTRGWLSGEFLRRWVDTELGSVRLENLAVPLFPVVTELHHKAQRTIRSGTLGFGVRASGSLPPFTPTTLGDERYVDGGVINNVPNDILAYEGAELIVASNVIPPPSNRAPVASWADTWRFPRGHRVVRLADEFLGVLRRKDDAIDSLKILIHASGDWMRNDADVRFQAEHDFGPLDFHRAHEIRQAAADSEELAEALEDLSRRWDTLRRERGEGQLPRTHQLDDDQAVLDQAVLEQDITSAGAS